MIKSIIRSTGRYLPERLVKNSDLEKMMDTSDEWIIKRTGIKQRFWVPENTVIGASDLAYEASKIALNKAGWKPEDLDLIIFGTLSPDIFFPGAGCLLQYKLGLDSTPAIDLRQQCTNFLYSLTTADAYIKSGYAEKILVVGSEIHSTGLNKTTNGRDVSVIFGDGAAVLCVEGVETKNNVGVLSSVLHAKGELAEALMVEIPASRLPVRITEKHIKEGRHFPKMDGAKIFKLALKLLPKVTIEALDKAGLEMDDIDLVIPHQANLRINQSFQERFKLSEEKVYHNIHRYGNTTAASIPIALDEAIEKGYIDTNSSTILFIGLGSGLTWGGLIYRFGE